MTPVQPPTPDEMDAAAPTISALISIAKWIGGPAVAAWIAGRFILKSGFKAGEVKQQYTELAEDVEAIKEREKTYITVPQHDAMQRICTANLNATIDNRTHCAMAELRAEMSTMNGNICKIMGALDIKADKPPAPIVMYGRRKDDH